MKSVMYLTVGFVGLIVLLNPLKGLSDMTKTGTGCQTYIVFNPDGSSTNKIVCPKPKPSPSPSSTPSK
jgi:hypothetical protein